MALLQALWPLQALTPAHGTWADAAAAKVATANAVAAVATIVLAFIYFSLVLSPDRSLPAERKGRSTAWYNP